MLDEKNPKQTHSLIGSTLRKKVKKQFRNGAREKGYRLPKALEEQKNFIDGIDWEIRYRLPIFSRVKHDEGGRSSDFQNR